MHSCLPGSPAVASCRWSWARRRRTLRRPSWLSTRGRTPSSSGMTSESHTGHLLFYDQPHFSNAGTCCSTKSKPYSQPGLFALHVCTHHMCQLIDLHASAPAVPHHWVASPPYCRVRLYSTVLSSVVSLCVCVVPVLCLWHTRAKGVHVLEVAVECSSLDISASERILAALKSVQRSMREKKQLLQGGSLPSPRTALHQHHRCSSPPSFRAQHKGAPQVTSEGMPLNSPHTASLVPTPSQHPGPS